MAEIKKKLGRPKKDSSDSTKKNSSKKNVQKMILSKIGLDHDMGDILIELSKEFNIPRKYFYLIGGSVGLVIFLIKARKEKKEIQEQQENESVTGIKEFTDTKEKKGEFSANG